MSDKTERGGIARPVTGCVITAGALAAVVARLIWPTLGTDAVTVTLLAIAAATKVNSIAAQPVGMIGAPD